MKERFDRIDAELKKIREAQIVSNSLARQTDTYYQLRELRSAVQAILYPEIFDDLLSAEIGAPDSIHRLEEACRELHLIRKPSDLVPNWAQLETKNEG